VADRSSALTPLREEHEPDIACKLGLLIGAGVVGFAWLALWHFTTSPAFRSQRFGYTCTWGGPKAAPRFRTCSESRFERGAIP
jgi:hypothetical protein